MSRVTEDLDHATHRRRHVAHLDRRKARTRISDRHWIRTDLDRPASVRLRLVETGRADQDAKVPGARGLCRIGISDYHIPMERWGPVVGWKGFYDVSNRGPLRSLPHQIPNNLTGGLAMRGGCILR